MGIGYARDPRKYARMVSNALNYHDILNMVMIRYSRDLDNCDIMKIVVFDDNEKALTELVQIVHLWKEQRGYSDIILNKFLSADSLLFSLTEFNSHDAFFLDIMTEKDSCAGFRVAEAIHQQNRRAIIVFTTNSQEYYESAFEIAAFRYLLKPLNPQKVYSALDEIYSKSKTVTNDAFIFQSDRQKLVIGSDQILYLESITTDHRAKLFLTDGSVTEISLSGISFSNLAEEKLSGDFYQCHRSYIVNLNYVMKYSNHLIILQTGIEIPVSRKYRNELTTHMIEHYKKAY